MEKVSTYSMPKKHKRASQKTQGGLLLEITALSGEYPAKNIHRIVPTKDYDRKVTANLVEEKLLKKIDANKLKGYRLTFVGKKKLLEENPERFSGLLEGGTETNRLRTSFTRRLRLHSLAEVCTIMHNAGVQIFQDKKPKVYLLPQSDSPSGNPEQHTLITSSCFYTSREQKGEKDNAIRGSRAAGTLLTPSHVYAIYNTGSKESDWSDKIEQRFMEEVRNYICRKLLLNQYKGIEVGGIMIGESMDMLEKYLAVSKEKKMGYLFLTRTYRPFYYITNDTYGEAQLKLICDNKKMNELTKALHMKLLPHDKTHPIEHDALTEDGNPVLFCCLLDIPRLDKFREGLVLQDKIGKIVAFDFQVDMLKRYLGDNVEFAIISFDGYKQKFFPDWKKNRKAGG